MAKQKKQDEAPPGSPAWMATFSDLMNLLLCFFVLLFSMSSINAQKFEQVVQSLSNSFNIFESGGSAIGEGELISAGMTQLSQLDNYYTTMGKSDTTVEEETKGENPPSSDEKNETESIYEAYQNEMKQAAEVLYDDVSDMTTDYNLGDYVELSIDSNYQYVQISLSGSFLFDSGKAVLKDSALPVFSRVGDILKTYDDFMIEIEGHTDNVPIKNSNYESNYWLSSARALNAAEYLIKVKGLDPSTLKASGRGEYAPIASNKTEDGRSKNRRIEIKIYNTLAQ